MADVYLLCSCSGSEFQIHNGQHNYAHGMTLTSTTKIFLRNIYHVHSFYTVENHDYYTGSIGITKKYHYSWYVCYHDLVS